MFNRKKFKMPSKEFAEAMADVTTQINDSMQVKSITDTEEKDILVKYSNKLRSIIEGLNGKKMKLVENIKSDTEELRRTALAIETFAEAERKLKNGVKLPFTPKNPDVPMHRHMNINTGMKPATPLEPVKD